MSPAKRAYVTDLLSRPAGELQVSELKFLLSEIGRGYIPPKTRISDAIELAAEERRGLGRHAPAKS